MNETNHILAKGFELFNQYGIRSVSMDDIARELGMSKKTIYQYFRDKNEFVDQVEQYRHNLRVHKFESIYAKNLSAIEELIEIHDMLQYFIMQYSKAFEFDLKKYYADLYNERSEERRTTIQKAIKSNLQRGISEEVYRSDIDPQIISNYKSMFAIFMTEFENSDVFKQDKSFYFREIFNLHILGILNEKGKKQYYKIIKEPIKAES